LGKEKTMPGTPIVQELPGNVPILFRTVSPKGDLLRYINPAISSLWPKLKNLE
jgi:hypothetical protein